MICLGEQHEVLVQQMLKWRDGSVSLFRSAATEVSKHTFNLFNNILENYVCQQQQRAIKLLGNLIT